MPDIVQATAVRADPEMFVGMWMTTDVATIGQSVAADAAALLMEREQVRRLPVLATEEIDSPLVGIVTRNDILRWRSKSNANLTVAECMTPRPLTATADAPIEYAAAMMRDHKIGALPVMRGDRLGGIITKSDVFRAFTAIFDMSSDGVRITFDISQGEDVLPLIAELTQRHSLRVSSFVSLRDQARPMCVVHVTGDAIEAMLENLWASHHRIESVVRSPAT
jgi:acetoin utilization protein AcuB